MAGNENPTTARDRNYGVLANISYGSMRTSIDAMLRLGVSQKATITTVRSQLEQTSRPNCFLGVREPFGSPEDIRAQLAAAVEGAEDAFAAHGLNVSFKAPTPKNCR